MSGRIRIFTMGLAAVGILGCGDKSAPTSPDYARGGGSSLVCRFNSMKTDANSYFAVASRPAVQDLITLMKGQYGTGGSAAATSTGFELLAKIAAAHDGTDLAPAGSAAEGSTLANDVVACMNTITPFPLAPIDFSGALMPTGAFEVRGGSTDGDATMLTADKKGAIGAPASGGFAGWTGSERLLFYAVPIGNTFLTEPRVGLTGYRWETIPERHNTFTGLARVGMCVAQDDFDRIQEISPGVARVLEVQDFTSLGLNCLGTVTTGAVPAGVFGRLVHLARALILPQEAYAAASGGGTGGLLGGLSDLGVVKVASVNLTISRIPDGITTQPLGEFTVTATAPSGSLVAGVDITLTVTGNSGSFNISPSPTVARTDFNGVAHFTNVIIDKAGGYVVTATSAYQLYGAQGSATSKMFHIKQ